MQCTTWCVTCPNVGSHVTRCQVTWRVIKFRAFACLVSPNRYVFCVAKCMLFCVWIFCYHYKSALTNQATVFDILRCNFGKYIQFIQFSSHYAAEWAVINLLSVSRDYNETWRTSLALTTDNLMKQASIFAPLFKNMSTTFRKPDTS